MSITFWKLKYWTSTVYEFKNRISLWKLLNILFIKDLLFLDLLPFTIFTTFFYYIWYITHIYLKILFNLFSITDLLYLLLVRDFFSFL